MCQHFTHLYKIVRLVHKNKRIEEKKTTTQFTALSIHSFNLNLIRQIADCWRRIGRRRRWGLAFYYY